MKRIISVILSLTMICVFAFACAQNGGETSERQSGMQGESQSEKFSDIQSEIVSELEGETESAPLQDYEILQENEQSMPMLSALNGVKTDWFNQRYGNPSWFKNLLGQDLVTVEISEAIDCFYAFYVLKSQYATTFTNKYLGCAGEGYFDGYNVYSSKREGNALDGKWVKCLNYEKLPLEITVEESVYKLDFCVAQKTVREMKGVLSNETVIQTAYVYSRFPLKLDGGKLVVPNASELYESYGSDQEAYSLKGKFLTVKPNENLEYYFMGDLINDEYFLRIDEVDGEEWLNDRFYHEDLEFTKELYLSEQFFTSDQLLALDGVFAMVGGELKVNFALIKQYLENNA